MSGKTDASFLKDAFIQEGVSPIPGVVIAACTVGDDYDNPRNRVGVRRGGVWLGFDVSGEAVLSVDATEEGQAYVLGESGTVVRFDWKAPETGAELKASRRLFKNPSVEELGPLRRLRVLGGDVLCAGSLGQVYVLDDEVFTALPQLTIDDADVTIEDLAGHGRDDFSVVTSEGHLARFDGTRWHRVALPLESGFNSLCALKDGYAVCGGEGAVLVSEGSSWRVIRPLDTERDYWGIATFQDHVYVAHLGGIDRVVGDALEPVAIEDSDSLRFTVLRGARDGVWSFADRTVGWIHDDRWHTLVAEPPSE
ncbi:hypothetical protein OWM54_05610 [Myxococcus sp. MISCRS1]|uniref:hypothetical protein n=1 Tax=Myxococcus sp. MISCRS1 TaxID=2996786 RepID=UPI002271F327|nr:hypothetical protein [Myxococcus sp. MISCRS1]MCY0996609.1 hypothetical protein [Myxococcus sp. MISCRS1]